MIVLIKVKLLKLNKDMEQLIKDLSDAYVNVKYHDDRANRAQATSALNDMICTCTMIIEKCNNLKNMMNY